MKIKNLLSFIFLVLFLSACVSSKKYYEPPLSVSSVTQIKDLGTSIKNINNNIAVLNNNKILSKYGLEAIKIPKGFLVLNIYEDELIIADKKGNISILAKDGSTKWSQNLKVEVVSASKKGDLLALILATNTIILIDIEKGPLFIEPLSVMYTVNDPIASPVFLDSIIIYPSLDGRLLIYSKAIKGIARDIIISANPNFNNIIYLRIDTDNMIVATSKKILIISSKEEFAKNIEIKQILADDKNIFILSKDGKVIKTDFKLREIASKKFKFALFAYSCLYENKLYIFENTGYLFKLDLDLNKTIIKRLEAAKNLGFMENGNLYYENKIVPLR